MATPSHSCFKQINRVLYSLCVEVLITILVLIDLLAITAELLIRLEILQLPLDKVDSSFSSNGNTTDIPVDPGGATCTHCHLASDFGVTVCAFHYISVVIAGLFIIEVFCRLISGPKEFCKSPDQVIDGLVVFLLVAMEILFTIFWNDVLCYHDAVEAATYIVIFRVIRIRRACNASKMSYADKMELTTHYLRECKLKSDEDNRKFQRTIKQQEEEIESLRKQILRYQIETSNETPRIQSKDSPSIKNGHIPYHRQIEIEKQVKQPTTEEGVRIIRNKSSNSLKSDPIPEEIILTVENENEPNHQRNKTQSNNAQERETNLDSRKTRDQIDIVHEYEQGTGEFIPTLVESESENKNENTKTPQSAEVKRQNFKKSMSEGSGFENNQNNNNSKNRHVNKIIYGRSHSLEGGHVQDIVTHIESYTKDKLKSPKLKRKNSDKDQLIKDDENDSALGADNNGLEMEELDEVVQRNLPVMAEYQGTRTYRSAEGIPLTDL